MSQFILLDGELLAEKLIIFLRLDFCNKIPRLGGWLISKRNLFGKYKIKVLADSLSQKACFLVHR